MLRVLAGEALLLAALHGASQLSFRGYRIDARYLGAPTDHVALVDCMLEDGVAQAPLDRVRTAVALRGEAGPACRNRSTAFVGDDGCG
jgi:hypothetical protein